MSNIITFYSYKGGAGRSMALANLAWVLASNGKRVLVIDWDLEAPGLHRYFRPFLTDKNLTATGSEGVIEMVMDHALRMATTISSGGSPWASLLTVASEHSSTASVAATSAPARSR